MTNTERKPLIRRPPRASVAVHGTRGRYQKGCRCRECTDAQSASSRERRERLRWQSATEMTGKGHGSRYRFESGCRCPVCQRTGAAGVARGDEVTPALWRCQCDAWRINRGPTCAGCGHAPPWIEEVTP